MRYRARSPACGTETLCGHRCGSLSSRRLVWEAESLSLGGRSHLRGQLPRWRDAPRGPYLRSSSRRVSTWCLSSRTSGPEADRMKASR